MRILRNIGILLGSIVFGIAAVGLSRTEQTTPLIQILIYLVYALAALFLTAAVWLLVQLFRQGVWKKIREALHKTSFTGRLYDDYGFRTLFAGHLSLFVNIIFALTKAAAGWYYSSVWLSVLAFYYLLLCLTKALVLRRGRQRKKEETAEEKLRREWKIYRMCGILLLVLTTALQGMIILMVEQGKSYFYHGYLIFVVAMYDFYCLTVSIAFMIRTRKKHTPLIVSVKSINFATSLVAMLTLQTAMFSSFADGMDVQTQKLMNIVTGTAVCGILIVCGMMMIRRAQAELKKEWRIQ